MPLSFGAAATNSDYFLTYPMDCILGLGRSVSNAMDYPTAMEAIEATRSLESMMFGVHLQRASDGSVRTSWSSSFSLCTLYEDGI